MAKSDNKVSTYLQSELSVLPFLCVGLYATPPQVRLQVAEDDPVPGNHHATYQAHEAPVLDVDATVGVGLVRGLLDELEVELVAERFLFQTFLYR